MWFICSSGLRWSSPWRSGSWCWSVGSSVRPVERQSCSLCMLLRSRTTLTASYNDILLNWANNNKHLCQDLSVSLYIPMHCWLQCLWITFLFLKINKNKNPSSGQKWKCLWLNSPAPDTVYQPTRVCFQFDFFIPHPNYKVNVTNKFQFPA